MTEPTLSLNSEAKRSHVQQDEVGHGGGGVSGQDGSLGKGC